MAECATAFPPYNLLNGDNWDKRGGIRHYPLEAYHWYKALKLNQSKQAQVAKYELVPLRVITSSTSVKNKLINNPMPPIS